MQPQTQVFTAQLLLPVTEAKEAQGTILSSLLGTGRTSVLSGEIRVQKFSQHISHTVTFCTSQFGLLWYPWKHNSSVRGREMCTVSYKTSRRATTQNRRFWQQPGELWCGQLSCSPHLPDLVMIISVPIWWNFIQRSMSSSVTTMELCG